MFWTPMVPAVKQIIFWGRLLFITMFGRNGDMQQARLSQLKKRAELCNELVFTFHCTLGKLKFLRHYFFRENNVWGETTLLASYKWHGAIYYYVVFSPASTVDRTFSRTLPAFYSTFSSSLKNQNEALSSSLVGLPPFWNALGLCRLF